MQFLKHEPWCLPTFWKAAITKPMTAGGDELDNETKRENLDMVLDRVRRLLSPLMIRRTKESVTQDGKPILTLPPVETKIIKVELSDNEREFYNAILARSLQVFAGFIKAGTAAKSYFQIFALLQRLRQACDHIALTVKNRIDDDDWATEDQEQKMPAKKSPENLKNQDVLGKQFLDGLLEKFGGSPKKKKRIEAIEEAESPTKRQKVYVSSVALTMTDAVRRNSDHIEQECPICLDAPRLEDTVLLQCGHIFHRKCLVDCLRTKASQSNTQLSQSSSSSEVPDGECPHCTQKIKTDRIISVTKDAEGGMTTEYLSDLTPLVAVNQVKEERKLSQLEKNESTATTARQILEQAVEGGSSSKMQAIMAELDNVWSLDPGSKVVVFSHYLGFLDLLETQFRSSGIQFFRLDGSLNLKERQTVLEQFRTSSQTNLPVSEHPTSSIIKGTVFLVSMAAGGEGLNLVAASTCFICDPWWNAAKEGTSIANRG
jgi:DNA repair protein RAD5